MRRTRREILACAAGGAIPSLVSALFPRSANGALSPKFDVDRLLGIAGGSRPGAIEPKAWVRRYNASATVTLFSIPIVSRTGVGSGFTVVEEAGNTTSIQFGAGSCPEKARGLNRLGFIHEVIVREDAGSPVSCAWFAFMTTSKEKSLEDAKNALQVSGGEVPYSASQGLIKPGSVASRVDRLLFPATLTWLNITKLLGSAREQMSSSAAPLQEREIAASPATFLYAVRTAILDSAKKTRGFYCFNSKQFTLETFKEADAAATAHFADRKLTSPGASVVCLNATILSVSGEKTPFRIWYERGAERLPPLRFEYQAKSFLRLVFESDAAAPAPPIPLALATSKENA